MFYHDIKHRVTEWVRLKDAAHRLRQLDNRLLADLGIEREHIGELVSGRCDK